MITLRQLCQDYVTSLPSWPEHARRGGGLTAKLVTERFLHPYLASCWEDAPAMGAQLDDEAARRARSYLAWSEPLLENQLRLLRKGIDEGLEAALDRNVELSVTQLADKLATTIWAVEQKAGTMSDIELAAVISTYLSNRPPRGRMLNRSAFAVYRDLHHRVWDQIGALNLAEFSYSQLRLGEDAAPPFVLTCRENTWDGLGRSVYSRFRFAARDAAVAGGAADVAVAEIARACGRLGLERDSCLVALHSLDRGFLYGPSSQTGWLRPTDLTIADGWKRDPLPLRPCRPTSDDERRPAGPWVHAEMASYAQAALATFVNGEAAGRYLCWKGLMNEAHEDAMRRAWMICFESDRRQEDIDGERGSYLVSIAIFNGIVSGQKFRLTGRRLLQPLREPIEKERPAEGPLPDQARLDATLAWLAEDHEFASDLAYGHADAVAAYERQAFQRSLVSLDVLTAYFAKDSA